MQKTYNLFSFIAWDNFTNPQFYLYWISSLSILGLFIFICQLLSGFVLKKNFSFRSSQEEFLFRFTIGLSMTIFSIILFAFLNALYVIILYMLFLAVIMYFLFNDRQFVLKQLTNFSVTIKTYGFWGILFIIASIPSLLPPMRYDEMSYHLPYAYEFYANHGLITDSSMRYPLYTFSWQILQVLTFSIHHYLLSHFMNWSIGVLCSLAITELLKYFNVNSTIAKIAGMAFFVTPLVQHNLNIVYVDVPIMFFMIMSLYSIVVAKKSNNIQAIVASAIICGLFAGLKITNCVFIPLFTYAYVFKNSARKSLYFLIPLLLFSSPWYLRNLYMAGDPLSPVLNMAIKKTDPYMTYADFHALQNDVKGKETHNFKYWLKFPFSLLKATPENEFADWPILGYVFIIPCFLFYVIKEFNNGKFLLFVFSLFGIAMWLGISVKLRYAHHLALSITAAAIIWNDISIFLLSKFPVKAKNTVLAISTIIIFIGPTSSAFSYFKSNLSWKIPFTGDEIAAMATYNQPQIITSINLLEKYHINQHDTIYAYHCSQYKYYFTTKGYSVTGDYVNKNRFADFEQSLNENKLDSFIATAKIKAIYLDKKSLKEYRIDKKIDSLLTVNYFDDMILNDSTLLVATIKKRI